MASVDPTVDPTEALNANAGFRDQPLQLLRHTTTRHVIGSIW
jgi:hypothetical protein